MKKSYKLNELKQFKEDIERFLPDIKFSKKLIDAEFTIWSETIVIKTKELHKRLKIAFPDDKGSLHDMLVTHYNNEIEEWVYWNIDSRLAYYLVRDFEQSN